MSSKARQGKSPAQKSSAPEPSSGALKRKRLVDGNFVRLVIELPTALKEEIDVTVLTLRDHYLVEPKGATKEQMVKAREIVRTKDLTAANEYLRQCMIENKRKSNPLGEAKKPNRNSLIIRLLQRGLTDFRKTQVEQTS